MPNQKNSLPIAGPWTTKSNGQLSVLFNFGKNETTEFTNTLQNELGGLRAYRVTGLKKGAVGAKEWHKIRTEMVFVTRGSATWTITESNGSKTQLKTDPATQSIVIPPNTLHAYRAEEDDTELLVVTNTSFNPDDPTTHDTYSADSFTTQP